VFSASRAYPDEPVGRASWAGMVKGKTERGILHAQGRRGKVRYHPMNSMTVLGYVSHNGQKNGEEPNDKPRKDTSINTRSVNLLGAS
jgi:hypothetical protein